MNNEEAYPASQSCSQQVAQFVFTGGKFSEMLNETRGIIYLFFEATSNIKFHQISFYHIKIPYKELVK